MPWVWAYLTDQQIKELTSRQDTLIAGQSKLITGQATIVSNQDRQTRTLGQILTAVEAIGQVQSLAKIEDLLSGILFCATRPGRAGIRYKSQLEESGMARFQLSFDLTGAPADKTAVKRTVEFDVDGVPGVFAVDVAAPETPDLIAKLDAIVNITIIDADAAGNAARGGTATYVIVDKVPPTAPGLAGLRYKAELPDEDPIPDIDTVG